MLLVKEVITIVTQLGLTRFLRVTDREGSVHPNFCRNSPNLESSALDLLMSYPTSM